MRAEESRSGLVRVGFPHQQLSPHAAGGNWSQRYSLLSLDLLFELVGIFGLVESDQSWLVDSDSGTIVHLEFAWT